jgi:hypothetical protein
MSFFTWARGLLQNEHAMSSPEAPHAAGTGGAAAAGRAGGGGSISGTSAEASAGLGPKKLLIQLIGRRLPKIVAASHRPASGQARSSQLQRRQLSS